MKTFKNSGISLISLVIIIIVVIILSAAIISFVVGDNSIIQNAKWATFVNELTDVYEKITIENSSLKIDEYVKGHTTELFTEQYIVDDKTPISLVEKICTVRKNSGVPEFQTINLTNQEILKDIAVNVLPKDTNLFYVDKRMANDKDHTYIYDTLTNTVFKIEPTIIFGAIHHHIKSSTIIDNPTGGYELEQAVEVVEYNKYIPIYSVDDFNKIGSNENYNIKGTDYLMASEAVYVLQNDLDFKNKSISPLPEFKGIFYGSGYTIKNISIDNTSNTDNWTYYCDDANTQEPTTTNPNGTNKGGVTLINAPTGIFSRVIGGSTLTEYDNLVGGKIHNIKILNAKNVTGKGSVGIIVGDAAGITIKDITIETDDNSSTTVNSTCDTITVGTKKYTYGNVGGVCGYLYNDDNIISEFNNITIKNVALESTLTNSSCNRASIVPTSFGKVKFQSCKVDNITGTYSGIIEFAREPISLKNCWVRNSNFVICNANSGGLVGTISAEEMLPIEDTDASIYNCGVDNCCIPVTGNDSAGGICGYIYGYKSPIAIQDCTVNNCTIISSSGNTGGLIGTNTADDFKVTNCIVKNSSIVSNSQVGGICAYTTATINSNKVEVSNCILNANYNVGGMFGVATNTVNIISSNISNLVFNAPTNEDGSIKSIPRTENYSGIPQNYFNLRGTSAGFVAVNSGYKECILENVSAKNLDFSNIGLNSNYSNSSQIGGLMGVICSKVTLKNIDVQNINMNNVSDYRVGGLVNFAQNDVIISGSINNININSKDSPTYHSSYSSGLVAQASNVTIEENTKISNINIHCTTNSASGIAGYVSSLNIQKNVEIKDITVEATENAANGISFISRATNFDGISVKNVKAISTDGCGAGLISQTSSTTVKDSTFDNFTIDTNRASSRYSQYSYAISGGLFALGMGPISFDNCSISNISVNNSKLPATSYSKTGGIVGTASYDELTIKNSNINNIDLIANSTGAGGIIGGGSLSVSSTNINDIDIKNNINIPYGHIGGLVGFCSSKSNNLTDLEISNINIVSESTVTSSSPNAFCSGGLIGHYSGSDLTTSNVKVDTVNITGIGFNKLNECLGGLFGGIFGYSSNKLSGITANNITLTCPDGKSCYAAGGIAGQCSNKEISVDNCSVNNLTINSSDFSGGITGISTASTSTTLTDLELSNINIISESPVTSLTPYTYYSGGVIGHYGGNNLTASNIILDTVYLIGAGLNKCYECIGGLFGGLFGSGKLSEITANNILINCPDGKSCYAAGGIIGHGSNGTTSLDNCNIDNLSINNSDFSGGIAGIAVANISNCLVSGNSKINSNLYAGGILGAGGQISSTTNILNLSLNKVINSIVSSNVADYICGSGTYYPDSYTGERLPDNITDCTYENVTLTLK